MAVKGMMALMTVLFAALLVCTGCGGGGDTSGGYSGGGGGSSTGTTDTTDTAAPQLAVVGNMTNPGKPIAPNDWIEVTGTGFGLSQGGELCGLHQRHHDDAGHAL